PSPPPRSSSASRPARPSSPRPSRWASPCSTKPPSCACSRQGSCRRDRRSAVIDAVLWDFGGVFTPSPFTSCRGYAETLGIDHEVLLEVAFGPYDRDTDHPWHKLERGEATLADAMAHAI